MSVYITNNLDPNNVGTPSIGNLVLFSGLDNKFYYKRPDGNYFPLGNGGFNTTFSLNPSTYDLTITDGNGTLTASLIPLASGYFNTGLSFNTASNVLSVTDAFGSVTASLSYYEGGFNQNLSYNTASNILSLTDGNSTLTASLTTGGANNAMTFNPFTNILEVTDGFGSVTASLSILSSGCLCVRTAKLDIPSAEVLTLNTTPRAFGLTVPAGYAVRVLGLDGKITYGTTAYDTNGSLLIRCVGTTDPQAGWTGLQFLFATQTRTSTATLISGASATSDQLIDGSDVEMFVAVGNPSSGDSDITLYLTYILIQL